MKDRIKDFLRSLREDDISYRRKKTVQKRAVLKKINTKFFGEFIAAGRTAHNNQKI